MLTREEDVDAHALSRQGWTISAIARHLGHDRKTIRNYLTGKRTAGERAPAGPDPFAPFVDYVTARLTEDPHLWAVTLFDELQPLGFDRSYPTLTRQIRAAGCDRHASRAGRRPAGRSRSSTTRRVRKPSGTGSSCPTHRPAGAGGTRRICSSVRSHTPAGGVGTSRRPRPSRISCSDWTRSVASSAA